MYNTYNPAAVSPSEMPIARRARAKDSRLWNIHNAKDFCYLLCGWTENIDLFTHEEWENIAAVANGGMWPVPDRAYTGEDWARDESFAAAPGQEVTEEIYNQMLDCMPPIRLPRCKRTQGYTAGFLMGEPTSSDLTTGKSLFSAFGKCGGRYYFIGLLPVHPAE